MHVLPTRALSNLTLGAILAVFGTVSPGCNKDVPGSPSGANQSDDGSEHGPAEGGDATDNDEIATDMPESAFNQLKAMWLMQVEGVAAQAQTLRGALKEHPDDQLATMVGQLETKVTDLRASLNAMTWPGSMRAIQTDIPRQVEEASTLAAKAGERLQEALRAQIGGG